jgi:glycosyltransferase involved in cell wall biosynthesis
VLYSTSSPVSAHLVGLLASRLTGLPWVADFRDAWTLNPEGEPLLGSASASLERRIVERAATLVVVDETIRLRGLEDGDPRRVVIPNGVDPDDVPLADRARTRDALTIAHVGMLYGARDVMPVLNALRRLVSSGTLDAAQIDLRLVGDVRLPPEADLSRLPVTVRGNVDHTEAVAEMAHADVLLLYQPAGWRASTGKIFEYLATGRPILCVAPLDSPAARLVTELGAGVCAAPDDADAIDDALRRLDAARRNGGLAADETVRAEALRRYSRRELARRLAETLDAVAGAASGPAVPLSRVVRS